MLLGLPPFIVKDRWIHVVDKILWVLKTAIFRMSII